MLRAIPPVKSSIIFKRISSQPDQARNEFLLFFNHGFFHTGWAARTPRGAACAASRVRRMPRAVHGACAVLCTLHTCAVCCAPHAARRATLAPCHAPRVTRRALCATHRARCVRRCTPLAAPSAARRMARARCPCCVSCSVRKKPMGELMFHVLNYGPVTPR